MAGPNYASRDYQGPEATEAVAPKPELGEVVILGSAKHVGGGWYELSNGDRVQGKDAAEAAQAKL